MVWLPWVLLAFCTLDMIAGIRVIPEAHRGVVLRFGRFHSVVEPGRCWVLPGVDQLRRVSLTSTLPDWQSLSEPEIRTKLQDLAISGQLLPDRG